MNYNQDDIMSDFSKGISFNIVPKLDEELNPIENCFVLNFYIILKEKILSDKISESIRSYLRRQLYE